MDNLHEDLNRLHLERIARVLPEDPPKVTLEEFRRNFILSRVNGDQRRQGAEAVEPSGEHRDWFTYSIGILSAPSLGVEESILPDSRLQEWTDEADDPSLRADYGEEELVYPIDSWERLHRREQVANARVTPDDPSHLPFQDVITQSSIDPALGVIWLPNPAALRRYTTTYNREGNRDRNIKLKGQFWEAVTLQEWINQSSGRNPLTNQPFTPVELRKIEILTDAVRRRSLRREQVREEAERRVREAREESGGSGLYERWFGDTFR